MTFFCLLKGQKSGKIEIANKLLRYMKKEKNCSYCNKVATAQSRVLNPSEQIELICLNNDEFMKGYISDNRFDAEVENQFVEFGKKTMILLYHKLHGLTEAAKKVFKLRFGYML